MNLPKIEDRIEIVQDKYDEDFGRSRLRTNEMELPKKLPGFYYHAPDLRGDDYEWFEMDHPLGKVAKDRTSTIADLHDSSQKFLTKKSLEERDYYSKQERHYPEGYHFHSKIRKFEDGKEVLMKSLQMLNVANRKLEAYDKEINRLNKAQQTSVAEASKPSLNSLNSEFSLKKPFKLGHVRAASSEPSLDLSDIADTASSVPRRTLPDYYYYNADMKRIKERLTLALDGAEVLTAPYVVDPREVEDAYLLKHYGPTSVMTVRPGTHFEVSDHKEITVSHMEAVVYRRARKYGFMFDRRAKLRNARRGNKSPTRSLSPKHANGLQSTPQTPSSHSSTLEAAGVAGGGIRPLLNTRHASLLFHNSEEAPKPLNPAEYVSNKKNTDMTVFSNAEKASPNDMVSPDKSNTAATSPSTPNIFAQRKASMYLDLDLLALEELAAAERPQSARSHKSDIFAEPPTTPLSEQLPILQRSLSISISRSPSRSPSRAPSRSSSRADIFQSQAQFTSPPRRLSRTPSPELTHPFDALSAVGQHVPPSPASADHINSLRNTFHNRVSRWSSSGDLLSQAVREGLHEDEEADTAVSVPADASSAGNPNTAEVDADGIVPFSPKRRSSTLAAAASNNILARTSSFKPFSTSPQQPTRKHMGGPVASKQSALLSSPIMSPQQRFNAALAHAAAAVNDSSDEPFAPAEVFDKNEPGFEYLTMMIDKTGRRRTPVLQRKPSVAFSYDSVSGRISDIHLQSQQPKRRPRSADLDKATQRTLLKKLQQRSQEAFQRMIHDRHVKELHHGKDLSKIQKISADQAEKERQALIELYEVCGGRQWVRQDNWCSDRPVKDWYGINVTVEGNIFEIHLAHNNLTGPFPDQINAMPALEVLNLDFNHLEGEIPEYALQKCTKLCILSARHNRLSGYLKFDLLVHLTSWREIWLSDNQLSGDLQDGICLLPALTHLDLDNNQITGPLPKRIAKLFNLQYLSLGRNRFTGHIPPGIMSLDRLETLSLYSNRLTGTVPHWLKSMPSLLDLLIFDNLFTDA